MLTHIVERTSCTWTEFFIEAVLILLAYIVLTKLVKNRTVINALSTAYCVMIITFSTAFAAIIEWKKGNVMKEAQAHFKV